MTVFLPTTLADTNPGALLVICLLVGVIAVIAVAWTRHAAREREKLMRGWARSHGHTFDPTTDKHFHKKVAHFTALSQGSNRRALNTATFTIDALDTQLPARLGDYTFLVNAGQSVISYHITYLLVTLPMRDLPATGLRPERLSDRFNAALGFDDINFEDDEFSRRYFVSSKDKRFAYDLLDPRMIELLKSTPHPANVEVVGNELLLTHGFSVGVNSNNDTRWSLQQCDERIAFARDFLARWPAHLRASLTRPA